MAYKYLDNNDSEKFAMSQAIMALDIINKSLKETIFKREEFLRKKRSNKNFHEEAIKDVLKFVRNDANYKIQKLLSVLDSIQKYTFEKNSNRNYGDYSIFNSLLENGQIGEDFRFLIDFGVPSSGIKKIEVQFKKDNKTYNDNVEIIPWLKQNIKILKNILLDYEYDLLKKALNI